VIIPCTMSNNTLYHWHYQNDNLATQKNGFEMNQDRFFLKKILAKLFLGSRLGLGLFNSRGGSGGGDGSTRLGDQAHQHISIHFGGHSLW
jgi:hypothetical protein